MAILRGNIRLSIALGTALSLITSLPAFAQQLFNEYPQSYTPAPDDRDIKAVLFNWTWHMGMLRGVDEYELIVSLEYQGNGSLSVDGQPCTLDKYRSSLSFQTPGQRNQYRCTLPNGRTVSAIEAVSGRYAWNEDIPGAEIVPGEGSATPMPNDLAARLIRLWASPLGAPKAALAGAGVDLLAMDRKPGNLPDVDGNTLGDTSVSWQDGKPTVSYPIPGLPGATAAATLDERYMAERVVVSHGPDSYEFLYSDYQDWNNPLNLVEVYYAGRMLERHNGELVLDLNTQQTETGSVYVVVPVPASVGEYQALPLLASDRSVELTSEAPTPRTADGRPDMSGNWGSGGMNWRYGNRRCAPTQLEGCTPSWNQTIDFEFEAPSRFGPNRPLYKPEHWDKVVELDMWTNRDDPVMTCQPLGIPRQGPPRRIIQSANDIVFFYTQYADGGGGYGEYRIIPTDGRQHDERQAQQTKYMGYTVGHWEGDTLVLESIAFNDFTWLARGGFFHSDQMTVTERLTRQGDEILYEVTVSDPEVLAEPWVMTPKILQLSANPDAGLLPERGHCEVYETEDIYSQIRH